MAAFGQAAPGSWAKVHLTRGQSSGGIWEIDGKYPQARISIGNDPSAGWAVQGPGVRPMHFELYWDGRHLFLADTQRAGAVTLNGMPVGGDWVQVRGRGEVVFGQAAMLVETSDAAPASAPADPTSAKRISMVDAPSSAHSLPELSGEATRLQDSPWESGGSAVPMSSEATRIQEAPSDLVVGGPMAGGPMSIGGPKLGVGMGGPPPPPPGSRPRLGGNDVGGLQAKTLMQDELQQSVAEATRMMSMPDNGPSIVISPGLMSPQTPMGGSMQMGGGSGQMGGGGAAPFGAPSAPGGTGFAAPPGYGEAGGPSGGGIKLPFGLSPRMAAMVGALGVAVIVLLFVGFSDDEPEYVEEPMMAPPIAPPPIAPMAPPMVPPMVPPIAPMVPPIAPMAPPIAPMVPPIAPMVPPTSVVVAPVDPTAPVVDPAAPQPPSEERVAADLVIAGHYAEALPQYQTLAMQHPERPEYSAMVHILEARLRAAQCVNGIGPDGRPCIPGR